MVRFNSIEEAIEDIRKGKMLIVVDDPGRENEGDLLMAADMVTDEAINFMVTYGRGLVCMPMEKERLDDLEIGIMVSRNEDAYSTAFTVSIDAVGTTTGISAADRAFTIKKAVDPNAKPSDFHRPGHIFPLVAKSGGVIQRPGHTEAAVDLAKLAGLSPAGVICEIMNDDGTMSRVPDLMEFAKKHDLKIITIEDLISYMRGKAGMVMERVVTTKMPTRYGEFTAYGYKSRSSEEHHLALVMGDITTDEPVLVRIHSECLSGDALGSLRCDCGQQYDKAMRMIEKEGRGILIYLRQEGRGIGLINKLKAYHLQDGGLDTCEANLELGFPEDMRDYSVGADILKDLNVKNIKLMTNNPSKIEGLKKYGFNIEERVELEVAHNPVNKRYLKTKAEKMSHMLNIK